MRRFYAICEHNKHAGESNARMMLAGVWRIRIRLENIPRSMRGVFPRLLLNNPKYTNTLQITLN